MGKETPVVPKRGDLVWLAGGLRIRRIVAVNEGTPWARASQRYVMLDNLRVVQLDRLVYNGGNTWREKGTPPAKR